jgi:hypothetical protein
MRCPFPACYTPGSSFTSWFGHRNSNWWTGQTTNVFTVQVSSASCYYSYLRSK